MKKDIHKNFLDIKIIFLNLEALSYGDSFS